MQKTREYLSFSPCRLLPLITLLALASASEAQTAQDAATQRMVETVMTNFSTWDSNGDGRLDAKEMTHFLQDPGVKGEAAAAVAALKASLDSDERHRLPALVLTRDCFQNNEVVLARLTAAFKASETRLQSAAGKPVFTAEGPAFAGVMQLDHGDCYLIAATGAIVAHDPKGISRMFEPGAGGIGIPREVSRRNVRGRPQFNGGRTRLARNSH